MRFGWFIQPGSGKVVFFFYRTLYNQSLWLYWRFSLSINWTFPLYTQSLKDQGALRVIVQGRGWAGQWNPCQICQFQGVAQALATLSCSERLTCVNEPNPRNPIRYIFNHPTEFQSGPVPSTFHFWHSHVYSWPHTTLDDWGHIFLQVDTYLQWWSPIFLRIYTYMGLSKIGVAQNHPKLLIINGEKQMVWGTHI